MLLKLQIKVISYGLVAYLFSSASILIAEDIGQVEILSEVKAPLQVIVAGLKGDELKNVQLALTLQAGLVHEGKVDRLWREHFKNRIPEKVRKALTPFGYYQVKKRFPLRGLKKEFTNMPFPNDWRSRLPQEPRLEPHGFIALNSDDL